MQPRDIVFDVNKKIKNTIQLQNRHIPSMEFISPLNKKINKKLIVMIRGHIRDAFKDTLLLQLIKNLSQTYDISLYLHTWSILQSDKSWRKIDKDDTLVTRQMVEDYFNPIPIKQLIIENEESISLLGNTEGKISKTLCPILCWKNMWYGMNQIIQTIGEPTETTILNIRYDIFTNRNTLFTIQSIQKLIEQNFNKYLYSNVFISNEPKIGIDNMIIGSLHSMRKLITHFYLNLDEILTRYPEEKHQEYIVFKENKLV